ncbi:hypothetical protein Hanom_Chr08g00720181 [Helianthus anomalus]
MDGVNEPDETGKISNSLDPNAENKPLDESRKIGQTSGTEMTFYSCGFYCMKNLNYGKTRHTG